MGGVKHNFSFSIMHKLFKKKTLDMLIHEMLNNGFDCTCQWYKPL